MPQLGSDLGNLKRLVERSRQTRRWETTAFPTSGGGTLHVPKQRSRGIPTTGGGEGLSIGTPPIGEIIRLGIGGHLGNGNEPVLFSTVSYRNGFNKVVVPSSQVELPFGAIYGIEGELRWADGYTGGGRITLLLDNKVYMSLVGFTSAWTRFSIATEFDAVQGQRLSVKVDHDDVDADHELVGELVIATKEPLKEVVTQTLEPPLTDLFIWWKADSDQMSAGAITTWPNEVNGVGWNLTDDGGVRTGGTVVADVLNGRPVVRLDGDLDGFYATGNIFPNGDDFTIYVLWRLRDFVRDNHVMRGSATQWHLRYVNAIDGWRWWNMDEANSVGNTSWRRDTDVDDTTGTNVSTWRRDGSVVTTTSGHGEASSLSLGYGRTNNTTGLSANIDYAEMLVYAAVHSDAERAEVNSYLQNKWGV